MRQTNCYSGRGRSCKNEFSEVLQKHFKLIAVNNRRIHHCSTCCILEESQNKMYTEVVSKNLILMFKEVRKADCVVMKLKDGTFFTDLEIFCMSNRMVVELWIWRSCPCLFFQAWGNWLACISLPAWPQMKLFTNFLPVEFVLREVLHQVLLVSVEDFPRHRALLLPMLRFMMFPFTHLFSYPALKMAAWQHTQHFSQSGSIYEVAETSSHSPALVLIKVTHSIHPSNNGLDFILLITALWDWQSMFPPTLYPTYPSNTTLYWLWGNCGRRYHRPCKIQDI